MRKKEISVPGACSLVDVRKMQSCKGIKRDVEAMRRSIAIQGKGVRGGGWDGRLGTSLRGLLESIAFSLSSLFLVRALSA